MCLELLPHDVPDAQLRRRQGIAPHLEHPAEDLVGLGIALEVEGELKPLGGKLAQLR